MENVASRPRRRRGWARVDWLAAAIVLAQFVVRTREAVRGYWFNDDWGLRHVVAAFPFEFSESFRIYATHFLPAPLLLFRLVQTVAPNSFGAAVLVSSALQGAGTVLVYLLLRRLFGPRPMIALLLLWFAFTTLTLTSSNWVFVSYYVLPFHVAFAGMALLLLRYLDRPSLAGAVGILAAELIALWWYEKAAFIPFALFALAAWFPMTSARPIGTRAALREHRRLWQLLGGALVVYFVLYFTLVSVGFTTPGGGAGPLPKLHDTFEFTGVVLKAFVTSVFGGPWHWTSGSTEAGADPPLALAVSAVILFGALVAWTSARRRVARVAWLFLFVYLLAQVALVAYGRLGSYSPDLGRYYRYFADAAVPTTLVLAFALLPTRSERALGVPPARRVTRPRFFGAGAYLALGIVFLVSAGVSSAGWSSAWSSNPGRPYVANARGDFGIVAHAPLIWQRVPPGVLGELFAPVNTTQVILSLSPGHPGFRPTVEQLFAVTPTGHIRPAQVLGLQSLEGPIPGCGWAVTSSRTSVPLNGNAFAWSWYVRVRYHASSRVRAQVVLGTGSQRVLFEQGTHEIFFPLVGQGRNVEIRGARPDAGLCVESVTVGNLDVELPRR